MSLFFLESFGHVNSGSLLPRKWLTVNGGASIVAGRSPTGSACQLSNGTLTAGAVTGLSMCCGWAMKFQQSGTFQQQGNGATPLIISLQVNPDGLFQILLSVNDGSAITNPSIYSINFGQWYYLELATAVTSFDATTVTISYDLHVNGISILAGHLTATGVISGHAPTTYSGAVWGNNGSWLFTDIYITDGEILGEVNLLPLFRAADGDATAWTPNIAGAHYLMVNQHSPDDNTTYIASSTAGQEDMGTMDQITGVTGTIKGIQGVWDASMLGGDSASGGYKSSGTTVLAANPFPLGLYTQYSLDPRRKSAFTGLDWTIAEINAMQLDCKKIS